MNLGFSYIGLIFLLMLMIPNIIWSKNKPKDYEKYEKNENKILLALERIGEVGNTCLALMFTDFNINNISYWSTILFIAFLLMILYEIYWIRYFKSNKTMKDMYSSILGIPVAGATLPVLAFLLLGVYGKNIFLIFSSIILGIGHIGIHLNRDCWARLYCSGGCAANAYHATGSVRGVYADGCDLFRKRMECAIAVAVARELGTE